LSEASGFDELSMDLHPNSTFCDKENYLFVHSTLPRTILDCQISDLIIVLRNPESIIRTEYLHLINYNSLNYIKKVNLFFEKLFLVIYIYIYFPFDIGVLNGGIRRTYCPEKLGVPTRGPNNSGDQFILFWGDCK